MKSKCCDAKFLAVDHGDFGDSQYKCTVCGEKLKLSETYEFIQEFPSLKEEYLRKKKYNQKVGPWKLDGMAATLVSIEEDLILEHCLDKQRVKEAIIKCCEGYSEFNNKCLKTDLLKELGLDK